MRILLADDHKIVRAGIRALLENIEGVEVIGEVDNGREAIRFAKKHHPKLILMDIAMSELNGLEATRQITKDFPDVHIIILSMYDNEEYVLQALRSGASGYVLKDASVEELKLAIEAVSRGEKYLTPKISKQVIENYLGRAGVDTASPFEILTSRQREILQLIAEGHSTKSMAKELGISVKTVETHRMHLMDRLGIHDIAGLVRYAVENGFIEVNISSEFE